MEKTHFERIIGGTEEEKKVALDELQKAFEERSEQLAEHELEKSPEDLEVIKKTEVNVDKIVAKYGGKPKDLPMDHIYILKPGSVLAMTDGKLAGGIHKPMGLKIGVEKGESKLLLASTIAHELFHAKSYKSARVGNLGKDVRAYRSGMAMFDRKDSSEESGDEKEYFGSLEEAIVAECTKKFLDEMAKESLFREEISAIRRFRDWVVGYYRKSELSPQKVEELKNEIKYITNPIEKVEQVLAYSDKEEDRQAYAAGMFRALYEKGEAETLERYQERKKLYGLLDRIIAGSNGRFENRDEIFDEFARANFSGNYLTIARIVENILGKGSFRKLAEEFSEESKKEGEHEESEAAS